MFSTPRCIGGSFPVRTLRWRANNNKKWGITTANSKTQQGHCTTLVTTTDSGGMFGKAPKSHPGDSGLNSRHILTLLWFCLLNVEVVVVLNWKGLLLMTEDKCHHLCVCIHGSTETYSFPGDCVKGWDKSLLHRIQIPMIKQRRWASPWSTSAQWWINFSRFVSLGSGWVFLTFVPCRGQRCNNMSFITKGLSQSTITIKLEDWATPELSLNFANLVKVALNIFYMYKEIVKLTSDSY